MSTSKGMQGACYRCAYRYTVRGSVHSSCTHFATQASSEEVKALFDSAGATSPMHDELKIEYDLHGFKSGWFFWPFNFDPVWLRNCAGFELGPASGRGQ